MLAKEYKAEGWIGRNETSLEALYEASSLELAEVEDENKAMGMIGPSAFMYEDERDAGPDPRRVRITLSILVEEIEDPD